MPEPRSGRLGAVSAGGASRNQSPTAPATSTAPPMVRMVAVVPSDLLASYCCCSEAALLVGSLRRAWYASSALLTAIPARSPPASMPTPVPPTTQVQMRPPEGALVAVTVGEGGGTGGRMGGGGFGGCGGGFGLA